MMTQSASPSQITLSAMRDLFAQKFPDRVRPFDQVKPDLEAGKGAQALANLIGCEVEVRDDQGFSTYCWTGRSGPFEMKVPKPFDPQPQRASETQQQAQVQSEEPETLHETPHSAPASSATPEEARDDDPPEEPEADPEGQNTTGENGTSEPEPTPPAAVTQGLFAALAALLGDSTLLMTVAKTGEEGKESVLTVTVVPQGETESFTPVCLTGSISELDTHFVPALESKAKNKKSLEQAVADLKAADKELEEAKKKEAEAKRKQTESKKKSAQKLEEAKKEPAKEEAAPPEPPKPEPQEALF
jgi:PRTRC genetic system protein E